MILLPVFLQIFSSISDSIAKTNIWVFPTSLLINSQLGLLLCRLGWLFVWQMCQFSSSEKRGIAHIFLPVSFPPTGEKSKDSKRCGGVKIHRERIREHSCALLANQRRHCYGRTDTAEEIFKILKMVSGQNELLTELTMNSAASVRVDHQYPVPLPWLRYNPLQLLTGKLLIRSWLPQRITSENHETSCPCWRDGSTSYLCSMSAWDDLRCMYNWKQKQQLCAVKPEENGFLCLSM